MFIQTEATPNPNTMKFLPGREISPDEPREYENADAAAASPLAADLFVIEGVTGVFLGEDFIAVTKTGDHEWVHLKPFILGAIMDALQSDRPVFADGDGGESGHEGGELTGLAKEIVELIDTRVRPAVARDGGDILFHSFDEATGVVKLRMRGACAGCPSSAMTLKSGIENLLKHYVPEVNSVEQVL